MEINKAAVISAVVDEMLENVADPYLRAKGYKHLHGVADICVLLAMKRDLSPELGAIIGLLHDYTKYSENKDENHAVESADAIMPLLAKSGLFTVCEIGVIATAIMNHSDKETAGQPYEELIKDADVFQHVLADCGEITKEKYKERSEKVKLELGL